MIRDCIFSPFFEDKSSAIGGHLLTGRSVKDLLELIPAEIFHEAYPKLEKQAWEQYYENQEKFGEAKDMTEEMETDDVQAVFDMFNLRYSK